MPTTKPTNIDAQRILAIMDELKEKLTYLSVVTPQVLEGLQGEDGQAACDLLGPELVKQFAEQIRLEENYISANTAVDGTFGNPDENEETREDNKLLQKNTLELCRKMRAVPNIVHELRSFQEHKPANAYQFLKTLADMQELTLKRLTTTLEEEHSRAELLKHYRHREQEANKRKQQLEKDLLHIRRECERAQAQRTEILTKLKADLLDVRDSKQERMQALRNRYENRMKEQHEAFTAREADLAKRINALKESNKKLREASTDAESAQKKQAKRVESDVEGFIRNYDTEIKNYAYVLNEYQDMHRRELKQLEDLKEHFEKVEAEKKCIENEEEIVEARKHKQEAENKRKNEMAALVQAFWRGILMREQYAAEKKKRKKKGGGKKKK